MGGGIVLTHIVNIVGHQQVQVELTGPGNEGAIHLLQFGDIVFLNFDEEIFLAEDIFIPPQTLVSLFLFSLGQEGGHLGAETAGGAQDSLGVCGQEVMVDTGLVIESIGVAAAHNLQDIAVPGHIPGEEQQMIVFLIELWIAAAHRPLPKGLVCLHADNRFDLSASAGAEELDDAVHGTVIGESKRRMAQTRGLVDEIVDAA